MEIAVEPRAAEAVVIRLAGRFDLVTAPPFRAEVAAQVGAGRRHVVVDLSGVPFIDSSGVGALIGGLRRTREAGGELRIAGLGAEALKVFRLSTVDRILPPYDTVEDALDQLV